ncbi:ATP-grasp domain-containing protein [Rossellomorea marisflavi]|uniref:ATP-grasp domain-containing protein n=1 Tax=Rossellomorea marisflavi TaxID=189381 RepID=UPI00064F84D2|nr:alpha-L-glutamate ligase [Rossellomorea marisflavi]KMK96932.1 alpha-L-glutamate ligase [Rossellomorea marisflavi]KML06023.1 alpha-L-glutamate ligase [Rossellomorea marisflavi]QHA35729.1 alpha-L-glutamate ligase [Rossellomorea marisflavi]
MGKIHIIHENSEWTDHLIKRMDELGLDYEEWFLDKGMVDLTAAPPEGIFYNRISASSHTRDHRYAPELTESVLSWLELHGRKVLNGTRAIRLEVSKVNQYTALKKAGIAVPATIAAVGKEAIMDAARRLGAPSFITKHNRAGKGLGVQLFHSIEALESYVNSAEFDEPLDGITLIQEYIKSPDSSITRCEFIGGEFIYAVRVDTSEGFELCPADACRIEDLACPVGERPKFEIIKDFDEDIIDAYKAFLKENEIAIAGIEFIRDREGNLYTYDVNTNTNYNRDAEEKEGVFGMLELARYLGRELQQS